MEAIKKQECYRWPENSHASVGLPLIADSWLRLAIPLVAAVV
jgi:hypothetical protein